MDRIEEFFRTIGHVERIEGEVNARDCSAVHDDLIANSSKLQVFVCKEDLDCLELGELPSNEVVNSFERFQPSHKLDKVFSMSFQEMRQLREEDVKGIHDLYPASEIESIEVFEKLAASLPGEIRIRNILS